MKDFIKSLFVLFAASSVFFIGFYLGEEKIRSKISDFQDEQEVK